ncbi:hypothetical protein NKG05_29775 [Oerskovia sp. M15]
MMDCLTQAARMGWTPSHPGSTATRSTCATRPRPPACRSPTTWCPSCAAGTSSSRSRTPTTRRTSRAS